MGLQAARVGHAVRKKKRHLRIFMPPVSSMVNVSTWKDREILSQIDGSQASMPSNGNNQINFGMMIMILLMMTRRTRMMIKDKNVPNDDDDDDDEEEERGDDAKQERARMRMRIKMTLRMKLMRRMMMMMMINKIMMTLT